MPTATLLPDTGPWPTESERYHLSQPFEGHEFVVLLPHTMKHHAEDCVYVLPVDRHGNYAGGGTSVQALARLETMSAADALAVIGYDATG